MKSLLLFASCLFSAGLINAQTFVSTTAENKNAVLEEFTGIYCGYCPDGHARANQFHNANPNDVVLINIHAGGFANPNAGDPDFRTTFGTAIDNQADPKGYPAGTINRRTFPGNIQTSSAGVASTGGAQGRGSWATTGATVLGESSPVNVANQTTIDLGNGQLTSVTEVYYTAAGTGATNKLNVVLLQNNVPGPQSGSSGNPSAILPNGDYNHQHMLRHMLTGQWGVDITATTATHFQSETHNYTIPADYLGVATSNADMTVSVFVAEGQQNIFTGAEGAMTYTVPPGAQDVSTSAGNFGVANYCTNATAWVPSFTAVNATSNTVTSIEAQYTINGGTPVPVTASGLSLTQGQSTVVTFPNAALPMGNNDIVYSVVTINGSNQDLLASNNNGLVGSVAALTASPTATTLVQNFDNVNLPSGNYQYSRDLPGAIFENPNNIPEGRFCVFGENVAAIDVSNCIRAGFGFNEWTNNSAAVIFDNIDLSSNGTPGISFDYAHALWTANTGDGALNVLISTDCGDTWTSVWNRVGTNLATASAPNSTSSFYPAPNSSDWATAQVDLSAYANQSSVAVKFEFSKGTSANHLYVDNINFDVYSSTTAIPTSVASLAIMPNPVKDVMNVEFSLEEASDLNIAIHNSLGQKVQHVATENFVGLNTLSVNTNNLTPGVYFLNITSSAGIQTERFIVKR